METASLIRTLAADGGRPAIPMARIWALAVSAALTLTAVVFFLSMGPRPDIAAASGTLRFLFKFVVTLALLVSAFASLAVLARPGAPARTALAMLLIAPVLLLAAAGIEMILMPPDQLGPLWIGNNAMLCMTAIPLIGIGPLAIFLFALRQGAPTRPSLAGAVAGLVAGGMAATFYATHCGDDSPLFVATWYSLAIAVLAAAGALAGRWIARW